MLQETPAMVIISKFNGMMDEKIGQINTAKKLKLIRLWRHLYMLRPQNNRVLIVVDR